METCTKEQTMRMVAFDVDGTLLDNKMGGLKDGLLQFGMAEEVKAIDAEYQRRKHLGPWGLEELVFLYRGLLESDLVEKAHLYCHAYLMPGAQETLQALKDRGYILGAISSNAEFLLKELAEILPLDFVAGTKLEFINGKATGTMLRKVDRFTKASLLAEKMKEYSISQENVTVVDDSITGVPMAEEAGQSIAFCPKRKEKELRRVVDVVIKKKDLTKILAHIYDQ